jgi:hypothetical protein
LEKEKSTSSKDTKKRKQEGGDGDATTSSLNKDVPANIGSAKRGSEKRGGNEKRDEGKIKTSSSKSGASKKVDKGGSKKRGSKKGDPDFSEQFFTPEDVEDALKGVRKMRAAIRAGSSSVNKLTTSQLTEVALQRINAPPEGKLLDRPYEVDGVSPPPSKKPKKDASAAASVPQNIDPSKKSLARELQLVREVKVMESTKVMDGIEDVMCHAAHSIMKGEGFRYYVPSRASGNQIYVKELDRICLGGKISERPFVHAGQVRKTTITSRVMQLTHEVLSKDIHVTKRDLFYTDVKLFKDQVSCPVLSCPVLSVLSSLFLPFLPS